MRVAVIEGLQYLLDNHLSHPILKALLPKLSPMIHDTAERVRIAFVDLLTYVRSIKLIKFYEIIPVEELLLRLSVDTPPVCKKLTSLLLNSYLPHTKENAIQV